MITLTKVTIKQKDFLLQFIEEWRQYEPCETPMLNPFDLTFPEYLNQLKTLENDKINPMSFYLVLDKNTIVGYLELRYAQNQFTQEYAGHMGYAILPRYRQRGYGNQLLKRGIRELKKKKVRPIILTHDYNHPFSKKMFESIGAIYIKESTIYKERKSIYRL